MQVVAYIEAGAVPALLNVLRTDFEMSFPEQGALGGVVYLFLSAASTLAGWLLKRFAVKQVMAISLVFNTLSVLLFSLTPCKLSLHGSCKRSAPNHAVCAQPVTLTCSSARAPPLA